MDTKHSLALNIRFKHNKHKYLQKSNQNEPIDWRQKLLTQYTNVEESNMDTRHKNIKHLTSNTTSYI